MYLKISGQDFTKWIYEIFIKVLIYVLPGDFMRARYISFVAMIVLIGFSLVLFGCTTHPTNNGNKNVTNTTTNGTTAVDKSVNLTNMTIEQMISLNKPIECTFWDGYSSNPTYVTEYISKNKVKMIARGSSNNNGEIILKDNKAYVHSAAVNQEYGDYAKDCDWISMIEGNNTVAIDGDNIDRKDKNDYNCQISNFGDDVFDVSGNICDI